MRGLKWKVTPKLICHVYVSALQNNPCLAFALYSNDQNAKRNIQHSPHCQQLMHFLTPVSVYPGNNPMQHPPISSILTEGKNQLQIKSQWLPGPACEGPALVLSHLPAAAAGGTQASGTVSSCDTQAQVLIHRYQIPVSLGIEALLLKIRCFNNYCMTSSYFYFLVWQYRTKHPHLTLVRWVLCWL